VFIIGPLRAGTKKHHNEGESVLHLSRDEPGKTVYGGIERNLSGRKPWGTHIRRFLDRVPESGRANVIRSVLGLGWQSWGNRSLAGEAAVLAGHEKMSGWREEG